MRRAGRPAGRARRLGLAAASGVAYFSAFPPVGAGLVGFVALAPLVVAVAGRGPAQGERPGRGEALLLGWVCGAVAGILLVGASVHEAAVRYFALSAGPAALAAAAVPLVYGAPFFALFALAAREIAARERGPVATALGIAAAWTASELARSRVGDGVPWLLLGSSQTSRPWLLQTADLCGIHGPSFAVALVGVAAALALLAWRDRPRDARTSPRRAALRLALLVAAVLAGVTVYGGMRMAAVAGAAGPSLRIALVQGNLPDAWRYSLAALPDALRAMSELTAQVADARPDLVVWPENAISVSVEENPRWLRSLSGRLPAGAHLFVGAPRAVAVRPGRAELRNSAHLIDPAGTVIGVYDKRRLTAWAEAPPWPASLVPGMIARDPSAYGAGSSPGVLEVRGVRFGTLICSEAIYADLAREAVAAGAQMLVVIGNDGWFGKQPAAAQHLDAVVLRAIETRRPVVRATATGITAVIDPRGHVVDRAPSDAPATLVADVRAVEILTPYVRWGDVFAWACVALAIALASPIRIVPRRRPRRDRGDTTGEPDASTDNASALPAAPPGGRPRSTPGA